MGWVDGPTDRLQRLLRALLSADPQLALVGEVLPSHLLRLFQSSSWCWRPLHLHLRLHDLTACLLRACALYRRRARGTHVQCR